jgi:hypothetical protein
MKVITLSRGKICALTASVLLWNIASVAHAQKKGTAGQVANSAKVGATWCYNWGSGIPSDLPSGVEFVPMWWGYYGATQSQDTAAAQSLAAAGLTRLLTYNEPDHTDQSNLSVSSALQGFSQAGNACTTAGLTECISPAAADDLDSWMTSFMAGVSSQNLRCDAVAVHAYQSTGSSFLSYIDSVHNRYGKPLWITEFAPTDWASPTTIGVDDCVNYINTVIPGLESRSYVERYSWYCGTMPGTSVLGTAALFNSDGTLTEVGDRYRSPGAAFTPAGYIWRLVNRADGKALDNYGNTTNGSAVNQYDPGSSPNQRWYITASGSHFKLQCSTGGLYLDSLGHTTNGSTVGQWSSSGSSNQLWDITRVGSGYFKITNVASGKCLDTGGLTANGTQMQLWGSGGSYNQQWMLIGY